MMFAKKKKNNKTTRAVLICLRSGNSCRQAQILRVLYKGLVTLPLVHPIDGWSFTGMRKKNEILFIFQI